MSVVKSFEEVKTRAQFEVRLQLIRGVYQYIQDFPADGSYLSSEMVLPVDPDQTTIFPFTLKWREENYLFTTKPTKTKLNQLLEAGHKRIFIFETTASEPFIIQQENRLIYVSLSDLGIEEIAEPIDFIDEVPNIEAGDESNELFKYKKFADERVVNGKTAKDLNQYTKDAIDNDELFFSQASKLNDPFEGLLFGDGYVTEVVMSYCLLYNASHKRMKKVKDVLLDTQLWYSSNHIPAPQEPEEAMANFSRYLKDRNLPTYESLGSSLGHFSEPRILSLTEDHLNVLMWAHYGDSQTGVCLQYSEANLIQSARSYPQEPSAIFFAGKVHYSKQRPSEMDFYLYSLCFGEEIAIVLYELEVLFTKYISWQYEREYRMVLFSNLPSGTKLSCPIDWFYLGCRGDERLVYGLSHPDKYEDKVKISQTGYDLYI